MKRFFALLISVSLALSGCASYRPMVDTKNANMDNYESDLRECQAYAENESPAGSAAVGAIAGAAVGALLAVVAGSDYDRGASAGVGAVVGGLSGGASSGEAQIDIIKNCMSGRGYRVLR